MKSLFAFIKKSIKRLDSQSLRDPLVASISVPWSNEGGLLMAALAANQIRNMRKELGLDVHDEDQRAA